MAEILKVLVPYVSPAALPLLICVALYFNFKVKQINSDRATTKSLRDEDSLKVHDKLLSHEFKISELQGVVNLHRDKLDSIDKQLGIVNQELVKLNIQVEHLANALEKQNDIMLKQISLSEK